MKSTVNHPTTTTTTQSQFLSRECESNVCCYHRSSKRKFQTIKLVCLPGIPLVYRVLSLQSDCNNVKPLSIFNHFPFSCYAHCSKPPFFVQKFQKSEFSMKNNSFEVFNLAFFTIFCLIEIDLSGSTI